MILLLVGFSSPASACPEDVVAATAEVETHRAAHAAARSAVRDTDWDYYLAVDDRDAVLARQAAAAEQLRVSRVELRDAKRHLREVESVDPTLACDPGPSKTTPG